MTTPLLKQSYNQKDLQRAPGEPATPSLGGKVCKSQEGYKEDWMRREKTEVTRGSGPRLGKSGGTLRELSSGGLEGPMRKGQGNKRKKGHSGVTNAPEGNVCPLETPTEGTPLPVGKQGKQGRESQTKILPYPKAKERAASLTPKKEKRGVESTERMCGSTDL